MNVCSGRQKRQNCVGGVLVGIHKGIAADFVSGVREQVIDMNDVIVARVSNVTPTVVTLLTRATITSFMSMTCSLTPLTKSAAMPLCMPTRTPPTQFCRFCRPEQTFIQTLT